MAHNSMPILSGGRGATKNGLLEDGINIPVTTAIKDRQPCPSCMLINECPVLAVAGH